MARLFALVSRNAVAFLALFVALGGTAYAMHLARNSVGSSQLKPSAVHSSDVKDHALKGNDIANGVIPDPSSPTDPLPSGETMRGGVGLEFVAPTGGGDYGDVASFPIPISDPIQPAHWHIAATASTACPASHTPAPGEFCVYPRFSQNADNAKIYSTSASPSEPLTVGFLLEIQPTAAGSIVYNAEWAYTAP